MKSPINFTKKDVFVCVGCVIFVLANVAAVGNKGRQRAKETLCQSNLRQWGLIWDMYTQNNNGLFDIGYRITAPADRYKIYWPWTLRDFYGTPGGKLTCCPTANNPNKGLDAFRLPNGTMGPRSTLSVDYLYIPPDPFYSSYGQNWWTWNRHPNFDQAHDRQYWKRTGYKNANNIPVFIGARNVVLYPQIYDDPPAFPEDIDDGTGSSPVFPVCMKSVCIDRHNGGVNVLFMDWSVRKVPLKGLWELYWHKEWQQQMEDLKEDGYWPPCVWPDWMDKFKDL